MTKGFGTGARLFHWLVVLLLLVQIPAGIAMIAPALEQESIDRLFVLHKGLGVVLLVVVVARVLWRLTHRAPPMSAIRMSSSSLMIWMRWTRRGLAP